MWKPVALDARVFVYSGRNGKVQAVCQYGPRGFVLPIQRCYHGADWRDTERCPGGPSYYNILRKHAAGAKPMCRLRSGSPHGPVPDAGGSEMLPVRV